MDGATGKELNCAILVEDEVHVRLNGRFTFWFIFFLPTRNYYLSTSKEIYITQQGHVSWMAAPFFIFRFNWNALVHCWIRDYIIINANVLRIHILYDILNCCIVKWNEVTSGNLNIQLAQSLIFIFTVVNFLHGIFNQYSNFLHLNNHNNNNASIPRRSSSSAPLYLI